MKKMNKVLLLIAFSAIVFSCSKDEDPAPAKSLEDVTLSLAASGTAKPVEAPAAMSSSSDPNAQQASSYLTQVNQITSYLSYFTPPQGSVKSSTRITAANGRVAATQTEYLVYTWSDGDYSVAYQISEQSGKYVFEIFTKIGTKDWLLYLYAEEKTDGSEGLMKVYNSLFGDGALLVTYTWKHTGDVFDFVMATDTQDMDIKIAISVNTKTKAGSVTYTIDGAKFYASTWDAQGNGSWTFYDLEDGSVSTSGTWKA
jgi:hypothetical protein